MMNATEQCEFEAYFVIVNFNDGSRVMRLTKKSATCRGVAFLGHGTVASSLLDFLGINEIRKEIVMFVAEKKIGDAAIEEVTKDLRLDKPNHGIAFSLPVTRLVSPRIEHSNANMRIRGENIMYEAIFVIADHGKGALIVDSAKRAGSSGATLINARGSGILESNMPFAMEIEPEQEIVLILSDSSVSEQIIEAVTRENDLLTPGNGILFTCDVTKSIGLYTKS